MAVTKHYLCILQFDCGSVDVTYKRPMGGLWQVVFRARCIPGHRIVIETHEDPTDPCDVGAAMRRLETLRQHFVAESIDKQRLEMQIHATDCCKETPGEFARRAEIHLFPRVASLCPDVGDELLSEREVCGLDAARGATYQDVDTNCKELEGQYTTVEWKRILGHESLRQWLAAGAYHPYFVSVGLKMGPKFS
jgi:hypothetical protein